MDIGTISAAIAGVRNAYELTKTAVAARDDAKLAEARIELTDRIMDVQNAAVALQEKLTGARDDIDQLKEALREAKQEIATLRSERDDRSRYKLVSLCLNGVAYEYMGAPDETKHFLCQPCFDGPEKRKASLRYSPRYEYFAETWTCPVCTTLIRGK
ncbi:hypothetical protein [Burkholderia contaminans]|uniref:hypothetical protein n=1 Tax=Burkholderia contaminans TaxID=488447 RepID=UPI00128D21D4|nr:hypothetical protein [Burkholderia contaminans]MEB4631140.1 hypothetical protein [Burkholderia contaminans]MEB4638012.1 hypothetical protein [Burkholderia contaminans]MEB4653096.1 hypothetical protein [Burkholderia contaminans]MEB4658132.1 hypothetical protein [Burkholderia contaminans]MEB4668374.1 hypothetical protein [Burkholderia contaminans]